MCGVFDSLAVVEDAEVVVCSDVKLLCFLAFVVFGLDPDWFRRRLNEDFTNVVAAQD